MVNRFARPTPATLARYCSGRDALLVQARERQRKVLWARRTPGWAATVPEPGKNPGGRRAAGATPRHPAPPRPRTPLRGDRNSMAQDTTTAFVMLHGARIAMSGPEAEKLRARGVISRPELEAALAVHRPEGGRDLDEVGSELAALRAGTGHHPVLFETSYVLVVPREGRTLYLDEDGGFTDKPDAALEFTPEGRRAFEENGSFALYESTEWQERLGDPIAPLPEPTDPTPALPPDPAHPARGREAVDALKRAWREDPCRDLAATPGYEAHRAELAAYQAAARAGGGVAGFRLPPEGKLPAVVRNDAGHDQRSTQT